MRFSNLKSWALFAEIIGGIAVVITLVVLVFEIRGNTNEMRQQQIRDAQIAIGESSFYVMNNAAVYLKSLTSPEQLSEEEILRMGYLASRRLNVVQQVHQSYLNGLIPMDAWHEWRDSVTFYIGHPFGRRFWELERVTWINIGRQEFVAEIDYALEQSPNLNDKEWLEAMRNSDYLK